MSEVFVFGAVALASVTGAIVMVAHRNPIYSALGLMGTMLAVAVAYVAQAAHFVAAVQVIVYAGAVMTLFMFVIMLIGVDRSEDLRERLPAQRLVVSAAGLGLLAVLLAAGRQAWITATPRPDPINGTIETVADQLFRDWVIPFEATTLLLIVAATGAVVLARPAPPRPTHDDHE